MQPRRYVNDDNLEPDPPASVLNVGVTGMGHCAWSHVFCFSSLKTVWSKDCYVSSSLVGVGGR